ncbi:MAG TPA: hypothetical protein VGQ65_18780 [Thermoanaerobaculia bacterium]|nr:hypothetical protein [Thermoanaerobaculia bacterium]
MYPSVTHRVLRRRANTSDPILQASFNVIGALENVSQAVGQPAADASVVGRRQPLECGGG